MGKGVQANDNRKQAGIAILISNKIDFQKKIIKHDKGHCVIIKGKIHWEGLNYKQLYPKFKITQIQKRNFITAQNTLNSTQ